MMLNIKSNKPLKNFGLKIVKPHIGHPTQIINRSWKVSKVEFPVFYHCNFTFQGTVEVNGFQLENDTKVLETQRSNICKGGTNINQTHHSDVNFILFRFLFSLYFRLGR